MAANDKVMLRRRLSDFIAQNPDKTKALIASMVEDCVNRLPDEDIARICQVYSIK